MPIPTVITDLSATIASNSPAGGDPPTQGDDFIRALSAFIRQNYDAQLPAADLSSTADAAKGDALVGVKRTETGAVAETQHLFNQSAPVSVKSMGAVGDGTTNDTAAFTLARTATGGRYHIPPGTFLVDASPDVLDDPFTASHGANIKIGVTTYDVSNAIAGPWRVTVDSPVLMSLRHAVTGNVVQQWQNGASGTATYFYRGLSIQTDSHAAQMGPATNGGSVDLLFQRSAINADPAGNRFNITFDEANDRELFSYATTASGSPSFDSAMQIYAGTSPQLLFPAIAAQFNQGVGVKQRAAGGFECSLIPTSSTVAELKQIGGSATTYLHLRDGAMGFFGSAGTSRPSITGSRGGNAALASLLTNLATLGLITDSTTA